MKTPFRLIGGLQSVSFAVGSLTRREGIDLLIDPDEHRDDLEGLNADFSIK